MAQKSHRQRIADGTHHFLGDGEFQRDKQTQRLKNDTHNLQKLTEDQVVQIKKPLGGSSIGELALLFGVSYKTIWRIRNRKTWKHVTNGE